MDSSLLADLNEPQRQAVMHTDGPLLIFAGAGSGKTSVLTRRIAYLIQQHNVAPYNILAVTFTNKASKQMKERIASLVGDMVARDLWAGTFHSVCARMLRERGDEIGIDQRFIIYDTDDQIALVKESLKELELDDKTYQPRAILSRISWAKEKLITARELRSRSEHKPFDRGVAAVYKLYQEKLKLANALDFDDLIVECVSLLKDSEAARAHYQRRFQYVHCDEFQDTNKSQYELLRLLSKQHKNLCVVGDDDQSIYAFRGADIQIILDFENDFPDAKVVKLEQNYRSTKTILNAAYHVVKNNKDRTEKRLWTEKPDGEHIVLMETPNENAEGAAIASEIRRLSQSGDYQFSDIAILYRTNAQSRAIEEQLYRLSIKYKIVGGLRFWERREVKDIVAYLRVTLNPNDSVSMRRIINVPARAIGSTSMAAVNQFASQQGLTFWQALKRCDEVGLPARSRNAIAGFVKMIEYFQASALRKSVPDFIKDVLETSGYLADLRNERTEEARGREENLGELVSVAKQYEQREAWQNPVEAEDSEGDDPFADVADDLLTDYPRELGSFLEEISLVADIDSYEEGANSVTLMTLHSAKGLEFPIVLMAGMEEGIFPHMRSFDSQTDLEEERRLCYVGITRAKERLYMSFAETRTVFGCTKRNPISRYITEIPQSLYIPVSMRPSALSNSIPAFDPDTRRTVAPPVPRWADVSTPQPKKLSPQAQIDLPFKAGDKVTHAKFGRGTVVQIVPDNGDAKVSVAFPSPVGIKTLMASFANLEKSA